MRSRQRIVLVLMCAGMFLVLLDVTVVNVAVPSIAADLHAGTGGRQWIVDGYAVTIASGLLAGGAFGERWGQRRLVLAGLLVFCVASLGCGIAPGTGFLVASRVLQGVGAALLLPSSVAVITETFPERREQAKALGVWAGVSSVALPAGPLLGGLLVDTVGWRWVFLVNVPVVLVTVCGSLLWVSHVDGTARQRLDLPGIATAAIGLAALVFAVIDQVWPALLVAAASAVVYRYWQRRCPDPVLPGWLFRYPRFRSATAVSFTMNLTCNGTLFVLTLYLQSVRGFGAAAAGTMLLPLFLPLAMLGPVAGRLTARSGPRLPIRCGAVLAGAGHVALLLVGNESGYLALLPALLCIGIGLGLVTASVVAAAVRALPADRAGIAAGVNNTARQTGTALGVAVFGSVAGATAHPARFLAGMHILGIGAALLWLVAWLLAGTVDSRAGAQQGAPAG